ncbi:hypothetical protein [Bacillus halotolerans]|uniref:Uncharacterized protein n=1 Tax=Bacillus halotolerans TaxID=260554 RepID=A0A9Q4HS05_9BACI|nr:hypothetical protein [Bacillus halotolerans]MCY9186596.1 hypothetical protein [Bacillus halotolerans]
MEEIKIEDYQGKERQTTRFFHDESQREDMSFLSKAGISLVAGIGLTAIAHRTGAMRKVARFLDVEVKSSIQAAKETLSHQGLWHRGQDRVTKERLKILKDSFVDRRKDILSDRRIAQKDILNSREMRIQYELRKRNELIGKKEKPGVYKGEVAYHIQEAYRHAAIIDDASKKLSEKATNELDKALSKGHLGVLDWGSNEQLRLLLKEHGKGVDSEDVFNVLKGAREKYKGRDFSPKKDEAYRLIEGMQERLRELTALRMQKATKKDNKIKQAIIGHKQATIDDILKLNEAGKIRINADLKAQINDALKYNKDFGQTIFDENLYLSTKNGELFDYKSLRDIGRNQAEWWANTIPGGIMHLRDILNVKTAREQAGLKIFQRGTILPSLNAHQGIEASKELNEEVLFAYGKFVKLADVDAVNSNTPLKILNPKRDMYLTSSQFGTTGKMYRHMSNIMTDNETPRNLFAELADLGRQDKDSLLIEGTSVFTKFFKKEWDRNKVKSAISDGIKTSEDFFKMNTYLKLNTEGFTPRMLNNLKEYMPQHIKNFVEEQNINFSRDEDMIQLFKYIGEREVGRSNSPHTDLKVLFKQFERNPDKVINRKSPVGESNPILGHHTHIKTGQDEINQQIGLYLTHEMIASRTANTQISTFLEQANIFRSELKGLHFDGKVFHDDLEKAESLLNYSMFRSQGFDIFDNRNAALIRVSNLFQQNESFQESIRSMSRKTNPLWERYSATRPANLVGDEYVAINESNIKGLVSKMFGVNSTASDRINALKDLGSQLSPFTGRRNMEDVTTLNLYGTYYPMYRLQDALGNIGLGFSDSSMGNSFQMFSALMMKRIFPVYAAVEGAKYVDWKMDQWTGEGLDERWENYKANSRLDKAKNLSEEDIYEMKRERMLKPGIEHWEAMPEVHMPGIGPIGMGDMLNNMFAPFMGKAPLREEDMMTYDETLEDLTNGTEEIRKSRWWFAGSKTAYRGDRIKEFAPNSFRLAHSDYEWTNTGATGEEYWGNHILPTLENPLGGLSFLLGTRDPYWFEKKHYYDRPYMLTGELFNPNTMALGDIGNATIGKLIKPVREMHPEYWKDPAIIYEEETSELGERPDGPIQTEVSPAGRVKYQVFATPEDYGSGAKYIVRHQLNDEGEETGAYIAQDIENNQSVYVPSNVARNISTSQAFEYAREESPDNSEVKAATRIIDEPSYQVQVSTRPRAMFDEEYAYKQEIMYRKMENIRDPRDSSWRMQEGVENWTEPLGVYKWIFQDELLGNNPYEGETRIQSADAAYNASNRFWDSELGSLGGDLSEIGRRFIRRDSGQLDQYNPIRNTMPDWLPGENYFINFQIGDPYSKVPDGERRLPGEAYESLNELHPDETGEYGAFDKFKILADVAPWSEEYKFWSQYLQDNLPEGDLRKEATQIRKQVSKRKQKYDFQPYRFKGNDVIYEDVTVKKFLDDYTFLTEEFGDQPIRIAGMEYRKKAEGVLRGYFKEGDKVTVGIAEDETQRTSKDTYGTMRAVIYNKLGNINKDIIEKGKMVENQNDFSAAGVHARFTPEEINRGSRWETLAHSSSPLNTKFLQVRTAVEEYERDQIYGKDWATWDNLLTKDYIIPTLEGLGRFDNPLWSGLAGGTTGLVIGRFFLKGGRPTKIAGIAGALWGVGSNLFFKNYEKEHGEAWIPKRRRIENDINEYFDILKYLKYEGLYEKSREEIYDSTGYDVEDFSSIIEGQKELTKDRRKELEEEKKLLYIDQPDGWEERKKEINAELKTISENFNEMYLPEEFLQALYFKDQRDTTLYGIDPHDDRMKVMRAFPYKDKWFFSEFAEANSEDREKILKLVPENQRRIYKALWGMDYEEQKPLEYYMEKYDIPDWSWEGWKPEYNLDDIKAKTVKEAGLDLSDFNFWSDDLEAANYVPDLQSDGNSYEGKNDTDFKGFDELRQNLISILQGQGLQDIKVSIIPSTGSETQIDMDYWEDRSHEIEEHLRKNGDRYI